MCRLYAKVKVILTYEAFRLIRLVTCECEKEIVVDRPIVVVLSLRRVTTSPELFAKNSGTLPDFAKYFPIV